MILFLYTEEKDFPVLYVVAGSGVLFLVLLIAIVAVVSLLIWKYHYRRKRKLGNEDEKRILVDPVEDTNGKIKDYEYL